MMQEQLSNNRIIAELDQKKQVQAVCTSSTADNKSRTVVRAGRARATLSLGELSWLVMVIVGGLSGV